MPRDIIILECTEAKAEGKPTSRYVTTRNKKSLRTPGRLEKIKYNPFLKRRFIVKCVNWFGLSIIFIIMSTEPKTVERRIRFRTCNRQMPRRRLDIPMDQVNLLNPDFLSKFTSETGKILPRRVTGLSAKMHRKVTREIKRARSINLLP